MSTKYTESILLFLFLFLMLGLLCLIAFDPFNWVPDKKPFTPIIKEKVEKPSLAEIYSNLEQSNIQVFDTDSGSTLWQYAGMAKVDESCKDIKIYYMGVVPNPSNTNSMMSVPYIIYFRGSGIKMFNQYIPR